MISFKCSGCGNEFNVPDDRAGKSGKCPKCGKILEVPTTVEGPAQNQTTTDSSKESERATEAQKPEKPEQRWWNRDFFGLPSEENPVPNTSTVLPPEGNIPSKTPPSVPTPEQREYNGLLVCAVINFVISAISFVAAFVFFDKSETLTGIILLSGGFAALTTGFVLLAIRDIALNSWRGIEKEHRPASLRPEASEIVPALIRSLDDPNTDVRASAAIALGDIGPEAKQAIPELERLAEKDPDEWVGQSAHDALEKIRK